jgi:UvrD-like helicase family protein
MSVHAFTGAAGTGKTKRLVEKLEGRLQEAALLPEQRVVALTRMHGSRFRMIERLAESAARRIVDCMTLDRFAWELVSRWRSRLRELGHAAPTEFEYDATCDAAAQLLTEPAIVAWVHHRFPVVVIDEFQDCRTGRLGIAQGLSAKADLLVAADAFQDLSETGQSPAVDWLDSVAHVENLTTVHRTSDGGLLKAALALRSGNPVANGGNAKFFAAQNPNVAAAFLARGIAWSGGKEVVVISPTTEEKSPFVRDTFKRLAAKPFEKDGKKYGPYTVHWERSRENLEGDLCERLQLADDGDATAPAPAFPAGAKLPGQRDVEQWVERQRRVCGQTVFSSAELRAAVHRSVQLLRAQPYRRSGLRAMTIHQAKNREFDNVLVLWPVQVPSDPEAQRRLLYNALTRAKNLATVIVQDPAPAKSRLTVPPFSMASTA